MKDQVLHLKDLLNEKSLRITPQRLIILEAVHKLGNHPTADHITEYVRKMHPNIASGTVYSVLDTLVQNHLVKRVSTDKDIMRYDAILENHHHLYCTACDTIKDYMDDELNELLRSFFNQKKIDGFQIDEFILQIKGTFNNCKNY